MKKKYYIYTKAELKEMLPLKEWNMEYDCPTNWNCRHEMDFLYGSVVDLIIDDYDEHDEYINMGIWNIYTKWLKELTLEEDPEYFL